MSFIKSLLKSIAATVVVTGVIKGAESLYDIHGTVAKILIKEGKIEVVKGFFSTSAQAGVQGVITGKRITSGWIQIKKDSQIVFSRQIPETEHQRLRNIILNA